MVYGTVQCKKNSIHILYIIFSKSELYSKTAEKSKPKIWTSCI